MWPESHIQVCAQGVTAASAAGEGESETEREREGACVRQQLFQSDYNEKREGEGGRQIKQTEHNCCFNPLSG